MPASSDAALALAGQLRSLTDDELAVLLHTREIREAGIRDFFDLAEALLDPASIQYALGRLDRPALATLAALGDLGTGTERDVAARLAALGAEPDGLSPAILSAQLADSLALALIIAAGDAYSVPAPVTRHLLEWPALGLPSLSQLAATPAPAALAPVSPVEPRFTDVAAAESAFSTTTAIAELIATLQHESARELARGGVALPDSKRLAASMGVDIDRVPALMEIAARAGLVALDSTRWMPTAASVDWLVNASSERWAALAGAWLERLPVAIRAVLGGRAHATWGERLGDYVDWLYPAGGEWIRSALAAYTRDADLLGITADAVPSTPGTALLERGPEYAAAAMAAMFPPAVEGVYLQHDLSIVSPGPLAPRLDARLRSLADVEGRALASTYRVSTPSLYRAMAAGETAESITGFLSSISLTGIPQPLAYLITEAAARYGLVRVGALASGRTYISSTDDTLLRTLLVDQGVAGLGMTRAGDRLESRFDLPLVFWALSEARYPVAAENAAGEVIVLDRPRAARPGAATSAPATVTLIEKLRIGSSADPEVTGKAWLSRQLDVAIRGKLALTVTVQFPDGTAADYQLEPASVAGGRLRARDRKADIERTLPLASITAVSPAE